MKNYIKMMCVRFYLSHDFIACTDQSLSTDLLHIQLLLYYTSVIAERSSIQWVLN